MEKRSAVRTPDEKGDVGGNLPENRPFYRVQFAKGGNLCFIGHRDLIRAMERLFRRARLPIEMSQGFHPKPRLSYLSVLGLGYSSKDEVLNALLSVDLAEEEILARLNAASIEGLEFLSVNHLTAEEVKLRPTAFVYELLIPKDLVPSVREKAARFLALDECPVEKANGKTVEARQPVQRLEISQDGLMTLVLLVQSGPEAGVRELLLILGLEKELFRTIFPVRTKTVL